MSKQVVVEVVVIPVVPCEDEIVHTADAPICDDPTCPCQEDIPAILQAWQELPSYVEEQARMFAGG